MTQVGFRSEGFVDSSTNCPWDVFDADILLIIFQNCVGREEDEWRDALPIRLVSRRFKSFIDFIVSTLFVPVVTGDPSRQYFEQFRGRDAQAIYQNSDSKSFIKSCLYYRDSIDEFVEEESFKFRKKINMQALQVDRYRQEAIRRTYQSICTREGERAASSFLENCQKQVELANKK